MMATLYVLIILFPVAVVALILAALCYDFINGFRKDDR